MNSQIKTFGMFAFIGFSDEGSDASLDKLQETLNLATKPLLNFSKKDELLIAQCDEVSFYVTISNN